VNEIRDQNHNDIEIYNASGGLISSINWNNHVNGRIIDMKWTENEKLCVLLQNGLVRTYYDFEGNFNEYEIGYDAPLIGIRSFLVWQNIIVVLLNDFKIIYIDLENTISVNAKLFKDVQKDLSNAALHFWHWDILPTGNSTKFEILISINKSIYLVSRYGKMIEKSIDGPFQSIHVSENHKFIALFQESSKKLFIVTANFNKALFDFKLSSNVIPNQIKWCGSDAITVSYDDYLKLIAPGGSLDFYLNNEFKMESEIDGLTILSDSTLEFLCKVNNDTVDCFKIGSTSKSSILIDSIDKLNKHSPKANENLKIIGSDENLNQAVQTCIRASFEEFDPYWQKKLLKAASFGKSALELNSQYNNSVEFVEACDQLRIINSIRTNDIGLFLTFTEYKSLGIEKIIKLLVKRQQFYQSFQIAKFLKLPIDLIFIDWACCKIKYNPNLNDDELSQSIITKFQNVANNSYISFEKISTIAFQEGRLNLAKILINFESLFTKQIPLLLNMEEHELALRKAVESQDVDLLLETLLILQESSSLPNFFKILNNSKIASNCFEYFHQSNKKLIHDYINQADRLIDMANFEINHYIIHNEAKDDLDEFIKKISVLQNSLDTYNLMRKNSNDSKQIEKQLKLMKLQDQFTNDFNIEFHNLSIVETLEKLILLNQTNKIIQFLKDFKVSEKKFYYIKLNYLIREDKFDELYEWSNIKKSPIGYEPFVKKAISKDQRSMALKFLSKCTNLSYSTKIEYLIKLQDFKTVIEEAFNKKDSETLERIEPLITTPRLLELLQNYKTKLQNSTTRFF